MEPSKTGFLQIIVKRIRLILIVTISVSVLTYVFTGPDFIAPKYQSFALIYPSNLKPFSQESPADQMVQLFQSGIVRDSLVKRFELTEHYGVDTLKEGYQETLIEKYNCNVRISKTKFQSVRVAVSDIDSEQAKDMVDALIVLFNNLVRKMQREKLNEFVLNAKTKYEQKKTEADSLENRLQEYRARYGLLDYEKQSESATNTYISRISGDAKEKAAAKEILPILRSLEEKGGEFLTLSENLKYERQNAARLKTDYEKLLDEYNKQITYTNIVTAPFVADKVHFPNRLEYTIYSALLSFLLCILILKLISNQKNKPEEQKT